jgi:hypothetical protein
MCTGTDCHLCGEPVELREIRFDIVRALHKTGHCTLSQCHALGQAAAEAIRPALLHLLRRES